MNPVEWETAVDALTRKIRAVLVDAGGYASLGHLFAELGGQHSKDDVRIGLNRLIGSGEVTTCEKFLFL